MQDYSWTYTREDWENPNQTIDDHTTSPTFPWGTADLIAIHYTAANKIPADIPAYLRAIQNDYVTNRDYSIGYNAAVTQTGDDYELRGIRHRAAANSGYNKRTFAILCLVDGADPLTDAAVAKVRDLVAWFRRVSPLPNVTIVAHREIGATACPGAGVYGQIESGLLEPQGEQMSGEFVKVSDTDTAILCRFGPFIWWLRTVADIERVADLCVNTIEHPTILSVEDRGKLQFLGRQPHYHHGSKAGPIRCQASMFGAS